MSHDIDTTTGIAAMAYVQGSEKPWHGLGQTVDPNASTAEWRDAAGLNWEAKRSVVTYHNDVVGSLTEDKSKHVLYRSDTGKPLSVVSADYKTVQPDDILGFFGTLAETGGFSIETVGALKQGRKIWALARVGENARILDDEVAPYLMLATSYDGSMATIAKFTSVRIVCNNTLQASLRNAQGKNQLSISHQTVFDAQSVRQELGIALDSWDEFKIKANRMARVKINPAVTDAFLTDLLEPFSPGYTEEQIKKSKGFQSILSLFNGDQIGTGQDAIDNTVWGLVQATTEYVDHARGKGADSRLNAAWFGQGAKLKERAFELADTFA